MSTSLTREIPWADQSTDPDRLALRECKLGLVDLEKRKIAPCRRRRMCNHLNSFALEFICPSCEVAQEVKRHLDVEHLGKWPSLS